MRIGRRQFVVGGAAVAARPLPALGDTCAADARLLRALDAAMALPTPQAKLSRLAPLPTAGLSHARRLDLETAREGLAVDIRLMQQPNRSDHYGLLLERQLGAAIDPATAHARLMAKWRALADEADRLLAGQGLAHGTTGERFRAMFRDPRWHYPDTSTGRDRAVADMNADLGRSRAAVPVLIGAVPPWCLTVAARRMTPAEEAARKGGYRSVAGPDRQGFYFVDLADIERRPSWSLASVVNHELLPGHMIEMPIDAAADPHTLRAAYTPAFTEGWAIYAEALMAGQGAFAADDRKMLGFLHWALFRIGRGIADTGIHHARWSVDEALGRLRDVQGEPAYFAPFDSDVERIVREPGIRAAEALTWLCLDDLRRAAVRDGDAAALRRFHQIVLADGRKRLTTIAAELRLSPPNI